jgi:hypothetical protein
MCAKHDDMPELVTLAATLCGREDEIVAAMPTESTEAEANRSGPFNC